MACTLLRQPNGWPRSAPRPARIDPVAAIPDSVWSEPPRPAAAPVAFTPAIFGEAEPDKLRALRLEIAETQRRRAGAVDSPR